jgi:UDP-N-acetylglucosamine acyltransferase
VFPEFTSMNRGTAQGGGVTTIGSDNLFMSYTHVAHDCHVGNKCVMANYATLGGHVHLGDWVIMGGYSGIHQFTKVGRMRSSATTRGHARRAAVSHGRRHSGGAALHQFRRSQAARFLAEQIRNLKNAIAFCTIRPQARRCVED